MGSRRRMRAFKRWMKWQSIEYSDAIELVMDEEEEEGEVWVKALCDLEEGDVIATIPKHSCLTVRSSGARQLIQDSGLEGYMALSVALMYEKSLGQDSPWYGYLQLLPDSNPYIPLLWSLHEIDSLLLGTELYKTVKEDKTLVCEDWKACIVPFVESAPIKLDLDNFSVEQYFAVKSLIASRSFEIDDDYGFGMVPLADLFNHKTNSEDVHFTSVFSHCESDDYTCEDVENNGDIDQVGDPSCQNESSDGSPKSYVGYHDSCSPTTVNDPAVLEMILVKDVKAGAEVFNTYGSLGNAALLHRYGFTEPDNPYDIVNIDLDLVLQWSSSMFSARHGRRRLSLWRRLVSSGCVSEYTQYFEISFHGEPEVELLRLLFIILLPETIYNELYMKVSPAENFDKTTAVAISKRESIVLGEVTETSKNLLLTTAVRGALLSLADIRERCYGSRSMEDDVEALKTCHKSEQKLYHSLMLRISERRILQKLRSYASAGGRSRRFCDS